MDISVSRLNKRMALELPPEFPLGLVFVVGEVKKLANGKGNAEFIEFCLSESDHLLNCRLSDRAAGEVILNEGDLIRAGGHLAFEPTRAGYYLLARDIEILSEYQSSRSALQRIITDKHERVPTTNLVPAEIPSWVEQLAPPEIRAELEERKSSAIGFEAAAGDVWELYARTDTSMKFSVEESTRTGFNADLIDFLSEAMDDQEDVELTPELLAEFDSPKDLAGPSDQDLEVLKELEAALMLTILKENSLPNAEIGRPHLDKNKKGMAGDLGAGHEPGVQASEIPVKPMAEIRLKPIEGLEEDQVSTSIRSANEDVQLKSPGRAINKPHRPQTIRPEPASKRPRAQPNQVSPSQGYIPWYVVGLILLLIVLFVVVFLVVALSSNVLPLPIIFPG